MGGCSSKNDDSANSNRNKPHGDGLERTFRLGHKPNTAEVISSSSHGLAGLGESAAGDKMAVTEPGHDDHASRRASVDIPKGFFLSLNVPYEDITFDLKMGSGTFGQVFKAHVSGKRCAVKEIFHHGNAQERLEILADFGKECKIMR